MYRTQSGNKESCISHPQDARFLFLLPFEGLPTIGYKMFGHYQLTPSFRAHSGCSTYEVGGAESLPPHSYCEAVLVFEPPPCCDA